MKKIFKILLVLLLLFLVAAGCVAGYVLSQFKPVSDNPDAEAVRFEIPYGTSAYQITKKLKEANLIKNNKVFYYLLLRPKYLKIFYKNYDFPDKLDFKSGMYKISPNMNYADIILLLSSGKSEYVKLSIPEGLTISKIGKILEENEICNADDFIAACKNQTIVDEYNIPFNSLEGYLFPDTYYFDIKTSAEKVARKMVNNFFDKISSIDSLKDVTPEKLNEIVILASIVEREYKLKEEAPLIASVFSNRIKINMGLQSCATIEYIITEINGLPHPERILESDLKIDSPYNTYKWAGLTPGPISNPGIVALEASANPAKTDYYFFQVIDASIGKHVFKKTFNEHKQIHVLIK